jgi:hypothetical protein
VLILIVFYSDGIANIYSVVLLQQCYWNDLCMPRVYSGFLIFIVFAQPYDHLSGLVARVPGYRSRGHGFDSRALQKKVVGLERWVQLRSYWEEIVAAPV